MLNDSLHTAATDLARVLYGPGTLQVLPLAPELGFLATYEADRGPILPRRAETHAAALRGVAEALVGIAVVRPHAGSCTSLHTVQEYLGVDQERPEPTLRLRRVSVVP